jgi:hypothetical protein
MAAEPTKYQSFCVDHWGYDADPSAKRSLVYPLRFKPLATMILVAIGAALHWPSLLIAVGAAGLVGTAWPRLSWLDQLWNRVLRHPLSAPALPDDPDPRRFACGMADAFVLASGVAFALGWNTTGWVLAAAVLLIAGTVVATGFCVAAWAYVKIVPQRKPAAVRAPPAGSGQSIRRQ